VEAGDGDGGWGWSAASLPDPSCGILLRSCPHQPRVSELTKQITKSASPVTEHAASPIAGYAASPVTEGMRRL
jgi:hypothetical protein